MAVIDQQNEDAKDRSNWLPWIISGAVVILVLLTVVLFTWRRTDKGGAVGTATVPLDAYAASLPITNIQMSEASNLAGGKMTYIDGHIANRGQKTVSGVSVQVGFLSFIEGQYALRTIVPLSLIRTREPYIDTQPVSANPLKPGEERDFRLIFETVPSEWNQNYPEIRITQVSFR